ncbi:nucleotidyltransferase family protein [Halovulum dunhuangense]|uniref:Nucleotidyltransferase family protein n=1 Tax=Halovulum dunhuangense TaxID=1505036 RepID=A0A849KQ71_9RHOB|nr:nucleotidyltransferase family protein [Halovulum dunhuangense]NNU79213.1 nucleotidyltransferase family protein [Halovulum dunhuangense]
MTPDTVMIFAAGRGTRMRTLTQDRPKPMIPVAGRPLIEHALDMAVAAGLRRAVVNTHYLPAPLEAHLSRETRLSITLSPETELLETGGGLKRAAPLLGLGPVFTMNADVVWQGPDPFGALVSGGVPGPGGARLLLVPRANAVGHPGAGDFALDQSGRPVRRGDAPEAPFVYTGLQLIDPAAALAVPEPVFSLNRLWDAMLAQGRLRATVWTGRWCDVGQPGSIPLAEAMLADG